MISRLAVPPSPLLARIPGMIQRGWKAWAGPVYLQLCFPVVILVLSFSSAKVHSRVNEGVDGCRLLQS